MKEKRPNMPATWFATVLIACVVAGVGALVKGFFLPGALCLIAAVLPGIMTVREWRRGNR
jgi:hypothetical protein